VNTFTVTSKPSPRVTDVAFGVS